jgi:hypothetical protein
MIIAHGEHRQISPVLAFPTWRQFYSLKDRIRYLRLSQEHCSMEVKRKLLFPVEGFIDCNTSWVPQTIGIHSGCRSKLVSSAAHATGSTHLESKACSLSSKDSAWHFEYTLFLRGTRPYHWPTNPFFLMANRQTPSKTHGFVVYLFTHFQLGFVWNHFEKNMNKTALIFFCADRPVLFPLWSRYLHHIFLN